MQRPAAAPVSSSRARVERLEPLCDPGSFRAAAHRRRLDRVGRRGRRPATASSPAPGSVGGRPVFCYAQDAAFMGGSLGEAHADSIVRCCSSPGAPARPVVGFVESGGARLQEGHAALAGYGRIFRASVELSSPGAADLGRHRRLGRRRRLLAGADRLRGDDRAGADVPHRPEDRRGGARRGGLDGGARRPGRARAQRRLPARRRRRPRRAARVARELLALLPCAVRRAAAARRSAPERARGRPAAPVPAEARKVYDVRDVAEALVDDGELLELARAGRGTWSPRSPASRAARSACSPTSRAGSAA